MSEVNASAMGPAGPRLLDVAFDLYSIERQRPPPPEKLVLLGY